MSDARVLPFPVAHDEGALPPDGEQGVGPVPEEDRQRVAAPHPGQGLGQGPQGLAVVAAVDQLDQHLSVGLADKGIPLCLDAIVHDADVRGGVGVAVDVAGLPVGGPAGVPDATVGGGQAGGRGFFQPGPQGGETPLALDDPDAAPHRGPAPPSRSPGIPVWSVRPTVRSGRSGRPHSLQCHT